MGGEEVKTGDGGRESFEHLDLAVPKAELSLHYWI